MQEVWVNFYNKLDGKKLGGYTKDGTFQGELQSTLELKAFENNIDISDIEVKYENEIKQNEIIVKCSICNDKFHTFAKVGEQECCTICDDVFIIEETDIVESS
ncbi:hypothetical protein MZM54_01110 [[Brevibacterium] frigoritolerans]|nr:hypothetical protein [Peribacillus frigoritolerans]